MQAFRVHDFGHSDVLRLEQLPQPAPRLGEILVAVHSIGVNPVDWKIREGWLKERTRLPLTPGQDFAGEVVEAGSEARWRPGDRVFGFAEGSYAEFALASSDGVARMPSALGFEQAAALPTSGLTALQLIERAALRPRQRVLIHGAAGSVGEVALQLAVRAGAHVIATALGADTEYAASLGADQVVDTDRQRFEEQVGELDCVLDLVGGELQRRSWRLIRDGGLLLSTVGLVGGPEQRAAEQRGVRAEAFWMRRDAQGLERLGDMAARGELRIRIARVLPFPEARQAQELSQHGAHGKVLLRVA